MTHKAAERLACMQMSVPEVSAWEGVPRPSHPLWWESQQKLPHGQVSWSEAALGFTDLPLSLNFSLTLPATRPQCSHSHWLMEASLPAVGIMRLRCVQPGADPQNTSK